MTATPKIYFAPFQGITTAVFRKVYAMHFKGVDKLFTPYFANFEPGHALSQTKMVALKNQSESGIEVVPQVLSKSAGEIIWLAQVCEQLGFKELNWNLGCPYPQVANKKRGSGILPYPEMVDEILGEVLRSINISFSVKCRLGYHSPEEMKGLIPVFNRYPISELTIHARIGRQLYSGTPDLYAFDETARQLQMPVVYNGDIFTREDCDRFQTRFPEINLMMIGRGILNDPFLPLLIKGSELPSDPAATIRAFTDDLYMAYRKERDNNPSVLNAMKEYWAYLAESFDEPVRVFRKVRKAKSFIDYEEAIDQVFGNFHWAGSENKPSAIPDSLQ
ncbi:MAG: tRNA-dihydrouridine synthase family protein [Bacteroidales bacterium]|nr:tRNA-dihydrouridine synthase family protein [Bacteroidales bacterium]